MVILEIDFKSQSDKIGNSASSPSKTKPKRGGKKMGIQ